MKILILGSGGREHAFAWKIKQSPLCKQLYVAPGNAGTGEIAQNIALDPNDFKSVGDWVLENSIDLVLVGPEDPLVNGIKDYFLDDLMLNSVALVGPSKLAAQLEGSKDFAKKFMVKYGIPTAGSATFTGEEFDQAIEYLEQHSLPLVLKADGLAAGKGVIICNDRQEAKDTMQAMLLEGKFGIASSKVVVEQYLEGIELSVFLLTDGKNYLLLPEAKDYKRIGEGDTGLNTGGMGAVSPVPFASSEFMAKVKSEIIEPTIHGIQQENMDYCGFVFIGLMNVDGAPFVIEYNVRMGDPETQAVLPRIDNDIVPLLMASANQTLGSHTIEIDPLYATTVVLVSGGYPEAYQKGKAITERAYHQESLVFHAGTTINEGQLVTNGGRVMAITSKGSSIPEALTYSYDQAAEIDWEGKYLRQDIGKDLLNTV
ncbi:MAG: phosphoribosylamine--glycine ligase [Cyclobacteriaceae bacterium]